ncbi:MAG: hypothetical protein A2Y10_00055 [Planctomycetes bacterium GWF2_41_51]|nr:MAG: hypothetical protein A2Y10_00055 [Planctomycetes bacterium GWF2_41_51]HBG28633.1 hypothetical protein [Phycisphaerales bacterium]
MCKKLYILVLVVLFFSKTWVSAANNYWTNDANDFSWSTADNWSLDRVPIREPFATGATYNDYAHINYLSSSPNGCNHDIGDNYVHSIWIARYGTNTSPAILNMNGGSISAYWIVRLGNDNESGSHAVLNMNAGTINCTTGDGLQVGYDSQATLNMVGGTINAGKFKVSNATYKPFSVVNLDGGILNCTSIDVNDANGLIKIEGGTLVIDGNCLSLVQTYINNGRITAYDHSNYINVDYNVTNAGKTTLVSKSNNPVPYSSCTGIYQDMDLTWQPGTNGNTYDVYFGTSYSGVLNATTSTSGIFKGNQTGIKYDPGTLSINNNYYWRIDGVNATGNKIKGNIWNFTTTKFVKTYSFESGDLNYWVTSTYGGITNNQNLVLSGNNSLEINSLANGTGHHMVFQASYTSVQFEAGKRYSISYDYDVKQVNTREGSYFYSVMESESGAGPAYCYHKFREDTPDGENWHEMKVILPGGVNDYKLRFYVYKQGHAIIDNIKIQELPSLNWDAEGVIVEDSDYEPYGICTHLDRIDSYYSSGVSDTEVNDLVDYMSEAGIQWFRVNITWKDSEIAKNTYDPNLLHRMDQVIDYSISKGVQPYIQLGSTPAWASVEPNLGSYNTWAPEDLSDWKDHVNYIANRYKGKIKYWEIRNEFNGTFWMSSLEDYVQFLKAAHDELKTVDPNNKVILGGLSKDGVFLYSFGDGLKENGLEKAYLIDGFKDSFDIFSIHPYCSRFETLLEEVLDLCNTAFRTMDKYNDGKKPVWITEQMLSSRGDPNLLDDQAEGLEKIFTKLIKHPRIDKIFFYNLYVYGQTPGSSSENSGIINNDFTTRPAYETYKNLAKSLQRKVNYNLEIDPFATAFAASNPKPHQNEILVNSPIVLEWTGVEGSATYDVYLGTNESSVANANHASPEYKGTVTATEYDPCGLDSDTKYYWAIDCNDELNPIWSGNIWAFTTDANWQVNMFSSGGVNYVSVDNGVIYADFQESVAWTLRHLTFKGKDVLCGIAGVYNGTVVNVDPNNTWIGTGHGGEVVNDFTINIDGIDYDFVSGNSYEGKTVSVIKDSNLGPFDLSSHVIFPDKGDYLLEKHKYTVTENLNDRFNYLYAFMHGFENSYDESLAIVNDSDGWITRAITDNDDSFKIQEEVQAVTLISQTLKTGITCAYPEVYDANGSLKNAVWDRTNNNKLYFRAEVLDKGYSIGDSFEYVLKFIPFTTEIWEWNDLSREYSAWGLYEAEDATISGATTSSLYNGFTGTGFVDYLNNNNDYIEWTVDVDATGTYNLEFRYALASGNRPLKIEVNGQEIESNLSFPATGSLTAWNVVSTPATLNKGDNSNIVRATAIGSSGANIDHLSVSLIKGGD